MSQSLFHLTTALHVSGVTITHLQEHKTTVITASGNHYTIQLSATIVEELELIWVCCRWPPTTHSNQFPIFHDSRRQHYGYVHNPLFYRTYCIFRRIYIIQKL